MSMRTGRGTDGALIFLPLATAEEHLVVQRESKARTTLLQSIPDDHIADFHYMDDARDIWNAVKARFRGNAKSKKIRKSMLKQEFLEFRISKAEGVHKGFLRALPSSWFQVALTLKTKGGLEFLSFYDLYYKLKTLEVDIKGYSTFSPSQSAGPSYAAFVSATSTSKMMPYGDSLISSSPTTYSVSSISKTGSNKSSNVIEDVLHSFVADTEPEQQLAYEDLDKIDKLDLEEMDLKWKMAMLSVRVHKFEQKAGRNIDFDKKESARSKGGNDKQRYSSFKNKETRMKEENSKALVSVDTLVDWSNHDSDSDEVFTAKEFGILLVAILQMRLKQDGITLPLVYLPLPLKMWKVDLLSIDKSQMSYGTKSSTSNDPNSVTNDFVSCDDSDKSSEVKTNGFASIDSSVKSLQHKPTDSTSCASTSSVSTSVNEAEMESKFGTSIKEPISVQDLPSFSCNSSDKIEHSSRTSCNKNSSFNKKTGHFRKHASSVSKFCFICGSGTHLIKDCDFYEKQMANTTVSIGVVPAVRPHPVPTGKPKVTSVPTGKTKVKLVPTGKPKVKSVSTGKPEETPFSATKDEGIFDSGCSKSITDTKCLVLSKDFKLPDDSMVVLKVPRKHNFYTINLNDLYPRGFPAQSIRSSNVIASDSPYLLVLITGTSQSRQHSRSESDSYYLFD
nr:ribonuclease H-like domain-containing protein [Tanacetum cinerariifolium]